MQPPTVYKVVTSMSSVCAFAAEQALLQSMPMAKNATTTTRTKNNDKYKLEDGNSTKQLDASTDLDSAAVRFPAPRRFDLNVPVYTVREAAFTTDELRPETILGGCSIERRAFFLAQSSRFTSVAHPLSSLDGLDPGGSSLFQKYPKNDAVTTSSAAAAAAAAAAATRWGVAG